MIRLEDVSKAYRTKSTKKVVLESVTAEFVQGRNIGILGVNGAGKSTLLRMLAGSELPDSGYVRRRSRVSFPLAFAGTVHPSLSGRENVAFIARVYGADVRRVVEYVYEFSELGAYFDMPTRTYSSGMQAKLAFGLCLAIEFDFYLIDEVTAVGDARFQARCRAAFEDRMKDASIIMVSHSFETIRSYCNAGALLCNGKLQIYDNLADCIGEYRKVLGVERLTDGRYLLENAD
jgi:capsular polysaccharide transport system ATP-binding protein